MVIHAFTNCILKMGDTNVGTQLGILIMIQLETRKKLKVLNVYAVKKIILTSLILINHSDSK